MTSAALPSVDPTPEDAAIHAAERLAEVARLGLATASDDEILRAAVRAAAQRLDAPTALVNVVYDDAVGVLSSHGLEGWMRDAGGVPVEWSFCRYPVAHAGVFAVGDLAREPALCANPLVARDGLGSYAGAPLVTSRGQSVGALCVIGPDPRTFTDDDLAALRAFADALARHLEARAGADAAVDDAAAGRA